jgi:hypothetical protein
MFLADVYWYMAVLMVHGCPDGIRLF